MVLFQAWTSFFSTEILRFPFSPFHFKGLTGRIMKRILNALIYVPQIQLRFWHMTMIDFIFFFPSSFGREYFPLGPFAMAIGWKVKRYFAASISRIYQIVGLFCWHRWWCHWAIATSTATATATAAEIYPWSFKWKKFEMNYTKQTMLESKNAEMLWKVLSLENFAESISIDCESFIVEYYNKFIWKYRNEWLGSCLTNFLELIRP